MAEPASETTPEDPKGLLTQMACPQCARKGYVYYLGYKVAHGSLYSPAADTEVDHYYQCRHPDCGHRFVEYT